MTQLSRRRFLANTTATFAGAAGVRAGTAYGEKDPERKAQRNGYRERDWQTRAGNVEPRIPKLRTGSSYFPSFQEHRRAVENALTAFAIVSRTSGVPMQGNRVRLTADGY